MTNENLCREICGDTLSSEPTKRLIYNISVAIFAYIAPLLTIFYSYFRILYVLHKRSDQRTFRFVKCSLVTRNSQLNPINNPSTSSSKSFTLERSSTPAQSLIQEEINSHCMKTITRAKLKTLKLTVVIGKLIDLSNTDKTPSFFFCCLVICFILCWTPYYCIVFFLLITDARIDRENAENLRTNPTVTDPSTHNARSLLIVMMLAVSNSVLDPLIYGNFQLM